MKRRTMLLASGAWPLAWATRTLAQPSKPLQLIVFMHSGSESGYQSLLDIFLAELKKLGHQEGRDISFMTRWAESRPERLPTLAADVVALKPALIVTAGSEAVAALKEATSSIPVVFATVGNPVEQGFIASLRRPGGNITGVSLHSALEAKITEVIRESLPKARRLAVLVHEPDRYHRIVLAHFEPAARQMKFEPLVISISRVEDLERAFKEMADRKADAVFMPTIGLLTSNRARIVELSLKARLPLFAVNPEVAAIGGLLSYGTTLEENYRRAAVVVDRVLKGAKPAELPVDQPERFHLTVNLKTGQAIGVTLPQTILLRADKVIE